MKILYIHQYFKTPKEPGGTRSYWIAQELIKNGHEVTMLTSSSTILNSREEASIDGIRVVYIRVPYAQTMSIFQRLISFFRFMFKSSKEAFRLKNIDLVIATSTPLTIGVPALLLKWFKKTPFVFEVRDLWPEVPIQLGGLKNKFLQRLAFAFEKKIYQAASHIIGLSPGMVEGVYKQDIKQDKVSMIPNMAKIEEFYPRKRDAHLMKSLGLKSDTFKIVHFGALGFANGAQAIIEGAKEIKKPENFEFIFIGGGAQEENLKKLTLNYNLRNVKFFGKQPMEMTSKMVNLCDVSIVSFLDIPILYTNSPNKFFDSLSAGKPIIVNSAGWTKDIVETHNCGYYVHPDNGEALADKLNYLRNNPEIVKTMGLNSRLLAESKYDKSILCAEYVQILKQKNVLICKKVV